MARTAAEVREASLLLDPSTTSAVWCRSPVGVSSTPAIWLIIERSAAAPAHDNLQREAGQRIEHAITRYHSKEFPAVKSFGR